MITSEITAVAIALPPIAPGIGGAAITRIQIVATGSSFSMETNPETIAQYSKFANFYSKEDKMIGSRDGMTLIYVPGFLASSTLYLLPKWQIVWVWVILEHSLLYRYQHLLENL